MLEQMLLSRSDVKLTFPPAEKADTAVILAGGKRAGFDRPICLQPLGEDGQTLLDRMLNVLTWCVVIQRTVIVTGWQDEMIRAASTATVRILRSCTMSGINGTVQ